MSDTKVAAPAAAASAKSKKANDGKVYEASVLPTRWMDRTIWMLTVQDSNSNSAANKAARSDAGGGSKLDPASGLVFPDMYYLLGERATVGKKDALNLAKCFKGTGHDTAEWPSGLITVKCGRCDSKLEDGVMTIQKHLRLIGKVGEKKITCRLMPRLLCDACYKFVCTATNANGAANTPAALPTTLTAHKSYWARWAELQALVTILSDDFIKTMSAKIGNGREAAPMEVNEHGVQTIKLVRTDHTKAGAAPAALTTSAPSIADSLFAPSASVASSATSAATVTAPTAAAAAAAAAAGPACSSCGKAEGTGKLLACGRCGGASYCDANCQKSHWKTHKTTCAPKA